MIVVLAAAFQVVAALLHEAQAPSCPLFQPCPGHGRQRTAIDLLVLAPEEPRI